MIPSWPIPSHLPGVYLSLAHKLRSEFIEFLFIVNALQKFHCSLACASPKAKGTRRAFAVGIPNAILLVRILSSCTQVLFYFLPVRVMLSMLTIHIAVRSVCPFIRLFFCRSRVLLRMRRVFSLVFTRAPDEHIFIWYYICAAFESLSRLDQGSTYQTLETIFFSLLLSRSAFSLFFSSWRYMFEVPEICVRDTRKHFERTNSHCST